MTSPFSAITIFVITFIMPGKCKTVHEMLAHEFIDENSS